MAHSRGHSVGSNASVNMGSPRGGREEAISNSAIAALIGRMDERAKLEEARFAALMEALTGRPRAVALPSPNNLPPPTSQPTQLEPPPIPRPPPYQPPHHSERLKQPTVHYLQTTQPKNPQDVDYYAFNPHRANVEEERAAADAQAEREAALGPLIGRLHITGPFANPPPTHHYSEPPPRVSHFLDTTVRATRNTDPNLPLHMANSYVPPRPPPRHETVPPPRPNDPPVEPPGQLDYEDTNGGRGLRNQHVGGDHQNPKIEFPSFDGQEGPEAYFDWENQMERVFACYG